jgi:tetratricopeptide (TPR) repeat protein
MFRQPKYEAGAYEVQGMAYEYLGQLAPAVNYHLKSLQIRERIGRKKPIALSLSHMGDVYAQMKSYDKAVDYITKALEIFRLEGDNKEAATMEYNLGIIYMQEMKFEPALRIFRSSIKSFRGISDSLGLANAYSALGNTFIKMKMMDSALIYHMITLDIRKMIGNELDLSESYSDLCNLFLRRKEFPLAQKFGQKGLEISSRLGILEVVQLGLGNLSAIEEGSGNFKAALSYLKKENKIRDSLNNQTVQEEIARQSLSFDIQKQQYRDSLIKAENLHKQELRRKLDEKEQFRKSILQYTGIFLFIMGLLAATFLIRRIQLPVIWLEGGIFFTALLLFEFLLLILDPLVDSISKGAPVYKFSMNLLLGLLVFYAHSFFESRLKQRLISGNTESGVSDKFKEESSAEALHSHPGNQEGE